MISSEEKKKLLDDMIKMSYQKIEPIELQRQLHTFLLRDTNGGKLYKYRGFAFHLSYQAKALSISA